MAQRMQVPFLGRIPMDPSLGAVSEAGRSAFGDGDNDGDIHMGISTPSTSATQNGARAQGLGNRSRPSSATLISLQRIIDQVVVAAEGPSANRDSASANGDALHTGQQENAVPIASNGVRTTTQPIANDVVHSNGDVPLDPSLHYRLHLGM